MTLEQLIPFEAIRGEQPTFPYLGIHSHSDVWTPRCVAACATCADVAVGDGSKDALRVLGGGRFIQGIDFAG
jgi:hypothetical protein